MAEEVPTKKKPKKKEEEPTPIHTFPGSKMEQLKELWGSQWYGCKRCALHECRVDRSNTPTNDIVFADGNPEAKIMIVGEAPGEDEAAEGVPFIGASGRLLNQILASVSDDAGIQELFRWYNTGRKNDEDRRYFHEKMLEYRHSEFFVTNVIACRTPDNRLPSKLEKEACWERLLNIIYIVDPWIIIACGKTAVEVLVGKKVEVTKMRGHLYDVDIPGHLTTYKVPVIATLHPSYLLRQADWKVKDGTYMQTIKDFAEAMAYVDKQKNLHLGTPIPKRLTISK